MEIWTFSDLLLSHPGSRRQTGGGNHPVLSVDELIPEQGTGLQGMGGWLTREGGRYGVGSGQLGESKEQGVAGLGGVRVADNMEYSPPPKDVRP